MKSQGDPKRNDAPADAGAARSGAPVEKPEGAAPGRERRSKHRVADDQGTGKGAMTALSKLRMLERCRASISPDGAREAKDADA